MKVICVSECWGIIRGSLWVESDQDMPSFSAKKNEGITLGKIYDVLNTVNSGRKVFYLIKNDDSGLIAYSDSVLVELDKWRELKLNELGI